jgi:hypothetical protein
MLRSRSLKPLSWLVRLPSVYCRDACENGLHDALHEAYASADDRRNSLLMCLDMLPQ